MLTKATFSVCWTVCSRDNHQLHSQQQAPWSPTKILLQTQTILLKNWAPGGTWWSDCDSNPSSDHWLPPAGLLSTATACCSLHVPLSGLSGSQWQMKTKATCDTPAGLLIVLFWSDGACLPFKEWHRVPMHHPIAPAAAQTAFWGASARGFACLSSNRAELWSSSHALHHLADYQHLSLGFGTMCWI